MSRTRTPKPLGDVLDAIIEHMGIRKDLNEARVVETWAALAGPDVNGVTDSAWVRGKKLFVKVHSPTARHDLHLNRSRWKAKLNEALGEELVEDVVFR